jgi:hypothetical protein
MPARVKASSTVRWPATMSTTGWGGASFAVPLEIAAWAVWQIATSASKRR